MTCKRCGHEHPPPNLAEVAEEVIQLIRDTTPGPRDGATVLALALGRLSEIFKIDVEEMLVLVRGSYDLSRTIGDDPMPPRGSEWTS